jgi:hypothetical protein
MSKVAKRHLIAAALSAAPFLAMGTAHAADNNTLSCNLTYDMRGWSAIYKTAHGTGTVSCDNGKSMKVVLDAKGAGLTAGTSHISNGHGRFTGVENIGDVVGDYGQASAEAGAYKSGEAKVVTKGNISLALAGSGSGWGAGISLSRFSIKRAKNTVGSNH